LISGAFPYHIEDTLALPRRYHIPGNHISGDSRHEGVSARFRNQPSLPFQLVQSFVERLLATRLSAAAIEHLARGEHGRMMGLLEGQVRSTPLAEVMESKKTIDLALLKLARALAT